MRASCSGVLLEFISQCDSPWISVDRNGIPNPDILRVHFLKEGRLTPRAAVRLIAASQKIFESLPNILEVTEMSDWLFFSPRFQLVSLSGFLSYLSPHAPLRVLMTSLPPDLAPATIVGDIHGQYYDLINMMRKQGIPRTRPTSLWGIT